MIPHFRCCNCGGTGLVNDDQGDAVRCADCDGLGIDNHGA